MLGTLKKTLPIAAAVLLVAAAAIAGGAAIKAKHATASKTAAAGHCDGKDAAMAAGTHCDGKDAAVAAGTHCDGKDAAMAAGDRCPVSGATMTSGGGKCPYSGSNADMAKACGMTADQAIYSFAVPTAECDHCVKGIQDAAMAQKGVACAHVDLSTHTAYIIADKSVDRKSLASAIAKAGFKNSFTGEGAKVQAEFAKAMAGVGDQGSVSHCAHKGKDKV
ncbi:MAG TPA: heavy metal-associated domain-containing protein [Candidatus Eisenbacteria bacterium]